VHRLITFDLLISYDIGIELLDGICLNNFPLILFTGATGVIWEDLHRTQFDVSYGYLVLFTGATGVIWEDLSSNAVRCKLWIPHIIHRRNWCNMGRPLSDVVRCKLWIPHIIHRCNWCNMGRPFIERSSM